MPPLPVPASSRVNPLPQGYQCPQGRCRTSGSGFTREEDSTGTTPISKPAPYLCGSGFTREEAGTGTTLISKPAQHLWERACPRRGRRGQSTSCASRNAPNASSHRGCWR
ncbi:hypothetical protein DBB42_03335 [Pseudomonas plecoglossicida]|uniref:Uncharacterized protein n=1 Tax=Pseudomonas plecoglossicida TaxID=70775 RepID=A0A2R7UP17_PSEDL|nr:hypothetical protein DBB42_03335 [Pseudomonas plecoglossicida]